MQELFWGRVGFTLMGLVFGLVFALTLTALIYPFRSETDAPVIIRTFMGVFGVAGLIWGPLVLYSAQACIYSLYVLYGYVTGFLGVELLLVENKKLFPKRSNGLYFLLIGAFAGILSFL
ncbi:MAG: hypothetical protein COB51_06925 [Moraxellaceae bacterium]|nr:MAG: hypothetical protein COB51_06925 [Moraxellaceae bacterium]